MAARVSSNKTSWPLASTVHSLSPLPSRRARASLSRARDEQSGQAGSPTLGVREDCRRIVDTFHLDLGLITSFRKRLVVRLRLFGCGSDSEAAAPVILCLSSFMGFMFDSPCCSPIREPEIFYSTSLKQSCFFMPSVRCVARSRTAKTLAPANEQQPSRGKQPPASAHACRRNLVIRSVVLRNSIRAAGANAFPHVASAAKKASFGKRKHRTAGRHDSGALAPSRRGAQLPVHATRRLPHVPRDAQSFR